MRNDRPSDPLSGDTGPGSAWFFSTLNATLYDLSRQDQWSTPQEISGTWEQYPTGGGCIQNYNGWYPTFMSLGQQPGHLSTSGYVFFMEGCTGTITNPTRVFASRVFTITTH